MFFTLEALFAKHGDSLLLHYGPSDDVRWILIDGGPGGVFSSSIAPRISQIRDEWGYEEDEGFPFEMIMVSHSDDDHINGVVELMDRLADARSAQRPLPFRVNRLWHNSFPDIIASSTATPSDIAAMLRTSAPTGPAGIEEADAALASVGQARELRKLAESFNISVNTPFGELVARPEAGSSTVDLGHGLTFKVLGPDRVRIDAYRERWEKDLKKILAKEASAAEVASFKDSSPFNLASIVVLGELAGKTMLFTGDARGDFVIDWLVADGLLADENDSVHFDLLKVPHHGSANNVTRDFFRAVTADHYVVSGDGKHGNPEPETLSMIGSARGSAEYTLHLTVAEDAVARESNRERKEALQAVSDWIAHDRPPGCTVSFRGGQELSTRIDLHDALDF